jgi:hypothetical protein
MQVSIVLLANIGYSSAVKLKKASRQMPLAFMKLF